MRAASDPADRLEVWAGVECTYARIGDRYRDQLALNGHAERPEDVDHIAALGVSALRYPVLWERTEVQGWALPDRQLQRLSGRGVAAIVGLVHHGSGPPHTSLVEDSFVDGLAAHAAQVARRYPWVDAFTPVNEPLTTARFSGLYGHWYPHGRDHRTFLRALVIQCRAIKEAMRAIRRVIPGARLVQTEDVGQTVATPALQYQAELEEARRWLSFDLLCGRVDRDHPLWDRLLSWGLSVEDAAAFADDPCPPDIVGLNYYLTSDRLLDERLTLYPVWSHGGNEHDRYADVDAVRAWPGEILGHAGALRRAWERYHLPVAVTEVHLGAPREQQLRWLKEAWDAAVALRGQGVPVRAITAWSIYGAFDWNSLLVREDGFYEPGVFDVRGPRPRPTALATMLSRLACGERDEHPVLDGQGWWRRPGRISWGPEPRVSSPPAEGRPILIVGASGTLGRALARICGWRGLACRLVGRAEMDIAEPASVQRALAAHRPWALINAAGYVRVDDAEGDAARCYRENTLGAQVLAQACATHDVRFATFSSDLVFGGEKRAPYLEGDRPAPANVYGRSKHAAEVEVLRCLPSALIVRTSAFFGPWDLGNFVAVVQSSLAVGRPVRAAHDLIVSPTYVPDLVNAVLDLLIDEEEGIWHVANLGAVSWAELALRSAARLELRTSLIQPCRAAELSFAAARPTYSALGSERAVLLPTLEDALARYVGEREANPHPVAGGGRVP
ncbi:MAG TPA: sugar nucleotide-binding protein [Kofleriaceae bacterium]|nr:sugar nucleotide-binding protein [Kofleriaceae bacterium]